MRGTVGLIACDFLSSDTPSQQGESRHLYEQQTRGQEACDEDGRKNGAGEEQGLEDDDQSAPPRFADDAGLNMVQTQVNDLYFAVAHPRFDTDPVCLRRQRENASAAAGIYKSYRHLPNPPICEPAQARVSRT